MRPSKRDELVQKALEVFYENGFHATGMDLLAKRTGVSKTSMYKHFRTKEELILAALRLRDENFRNWLIRKMEELADTPQGQLLACFDALEQWFEEPGYKGCMFIKAAAEYQQADDPIHRAAADHKRQLLAHFSSLAQEAGAKDPSKLASQLLLLKEGAIVLAQMRGTSKAAQEAKSAAEALIKTAF